MKLSVIIPARNEFPNVVHTFYSIVHSLESEGFTPKDFEVIIVDNCSDDNVWPQRGTKGTTSYLEARGAYYKCVLRVLRDPIAGNHSARNKGANIARGEYVFFSDAHMAYKPGFFTLMIEAQKESGGLVHGGVQWMGAYPSVADGLGVGYSIKLGEEIKGTWNNYSISDKDWFYVPAQGHWGVMANKKQFLNYGGYPKVHRTYGGGEFYLDMKWWLFGSCVVTEPRAVGYHLASGRGYSYNHDDYIHNVFNIAYALGMDDWLERAYINYLRNGRKEVLDRMMAEAQEEMAKDRKFIEKHRRMTFNQLIVKRPWDELNKKRHDYCHSGLTIFHDTWLKIMEQSPQAKEAYEKSKYQKGLAEFIDTNLKDYIYKKDK